MRIAVLMPAYAEGERLARTVAELAAAAAASAGAGAGAGPGSEARDREVTLFVVDDGSPSPVDEAALATAAAGAIRVVLARHAVNLGQGAAIETARRLALDPRFSGSGFDAYVTMDADGQHRAEDVFALAAAIVSGADVALGDRFAGGSDVPRARRGLLALARAFERVTTGARLSDAHNGLRAFGPRAIAAMRIRHNRMAHATELTRAISRAELAVVEVPVSVRYTDESMKKGQRASGAVAILVDLFQGFLFR